MALLVLLAVGCAVRPLPVGEAVTGRERLAVEEEFTATMAWRQDRLRCLDAEAEVSWRSLLRSGVLPGYLRMMPPSRLKFVGTDPLGRPVLVLAVDGGFFRLISVPETRVYEGPTSARAFRRYLPAKVEPQTLSDSLFAWLSGGLPFTAEVVAVYRQHRDPAGEGGNGEPELKPEGPNYWLEVAEPRHARLLYSPGSGHAPGQLRRIQLFERRDGAPTEIVYEQYRLPATADPDRDLLLPHRIELLSSRQHGLNLTIRLDDVLTDCPPGADFQLPVPRGFTVEPVQ